MYREPRQQRKRRGRDLERLKGQRASIPDYRLSLYESGLTALLDAGAGFIIFGCEAREDCYVQFGVGQKSNGLYAEVGSGPVSEAGHEMLTGKDFRPPDDLTPNYHQEFEVTDVRGLAKLVDAAFVDALECSESFTTKVVDASNEGVFGSSAGRSHAQERKEGGRDRSEKLGAHLGKVWSASARRLQWVRIPLLPRLLAYGADWLKQILGWRVLGLPVYGYLIIVLVILFAILLVYAAVTSDENPYGYTG